MKKRFLWMLSVITICILFAGCTPKARYERTLKRELSSGIRNDSLFFGIRLGMTSKEFYAHCWNLNKQGLVKQGSVNRSVEYITRDELKHKAAMNFYPTFNHDKIVEMPVRFSYTGWAPWNKKLAADSLQMDIINWYSKKYGEGFIKVKHPIHGTAFVKVDGNRRITVFKETSLIVWAVFRDMSAEMPEIDSFGNKTE